MTLPIGGIEDLDLVDVSELLDPLGGAEKLGDEGTPGREPDPLQVPDGRRLGVVEQAGYLPERGPAVVRGRRVYDDPVGQPGQPGKLGGARGEPAGVPEEDGQKIGRASCRERV